MSLMNIIALKHFDDGSREHLLKHSSQISYRHSAGLRFGENESHDLHQAIQRALAPRGYGRGHKETTPNRVEMSSQVKRNREKELCINV